MSKSPTIECTPNGPYLVKELPELTNSQGTGIPHGTVIALCRCGGSAKKPFCDGSHAKNGFSGNHSADRTQDVLDEYREKTVTIHDNRSICAHAGRCTEGLPNVFKYGEAPRIDANGAEAEAIINTIKRCPSGALSYSLEEESKTTDLLLPSVTVTKDGPYEIVGRVELRNERWAKGASPVRYTLCRCGASKNKPFCDGSHWAIEFKDACP